MATTTSTGNIETYLGAKAEYFLGYKAPKISKERLHLPGPDFVDRVYAASNRNVRVLTNLQRIFGHGRLAHTGYLSILPVDQGIEHSAGASFAKNPDYFDAENIVKLAVEGGCNAVASTFGLGALSRKSITTSCSPSRIARIKFSSAPCRKPGTWAQPPLEPRSISAPIKARAKSWKSARPSLTPTNSAWPPFSGATSATMRSRKIRTITSPPTSLARRIILASPSRPTSSSRNCPKITAAT